MKKTLAVLLCLLMLLSLTLVGCTSGDSDDKDSDKIDLSEKENPFEGKWVAEVDFGAQMAEQMGVGSMDTSDMIVKLSFTFTKKGVCTMEADKDSVKKVLNRTMELAAESMGMSLNDLIALQGMSQADYEAQLDEQIEDLAQELSGEGAYKVEDGKFYLNNDVDSDEFDEDYECYDYSIKGNTITVKNMLDEGTDIVLKPAK